MSSKLGPVEIEFVLKGINFKQESKRIQDIIKGISTTTQDEVNKTNTLLKRLGTGVAAYFSLQAMGGFAQSVIEVRGEFQQLGIALETMLGSKEKADRLTAQIVSLSAKTPFSLTEVGQGAKQLLAFDVAQEDVIDTLTRLGNISAGVSAPVGELIRAYGQVKAKGRLQAEEINQFAEKGVPLVSELSRVLGVTNAEVLKMTEQGKVGFDDMNKAIKNLTDDGGKFFNLMEKQSKSLTGLVSNLGDAFDRALNQIGESNEGVITGTIEGLTLLVENYQEVIDILKVVALTYGTYRAALLALSLAEKVRYQMTLAQMASTKGLTALEALHAVVVGKVKDAQALLNKTMLANPYVLAATALAALYGGLKLYNKYVKDSIGVSGEFKESLEKEVNAIRNNFDAINKANVGTDDRRKAIAEVNFKYKEYLPNLLDEKSSLEDVAAAQKKVTEALAQTIALKAKENDLASFKQNTANAADDYAGALASVFGDRSKFTAEIEGKAIAALDKLKGASDNASIGIKQIKEALFEAGVQTDLSITDYNKLFSTINSYVAFSKKEEKAITDLDEVYKSYLKSLGLIQEEKATATNDTSSTTVKTIKSLEDELAALEKRRKEATDINDAQELERLKTLILAKRQEIAKFKIESERPSSKTELEQFEADIKAKKELYEQFEAYKRVVSENEARAMYADLLKQGGSYIEYLRGQLAVLPTGDKKAIVATQIASTEKVDTNESTKAMEELLQRTQSYNQKRIALTYSYIQERIKLEKIGAKENIEVLDQQYKDELAALEESHIKKSESYRWVFDDIQRMNRQALRDYIDRLKKEVENSKLTAEVKLQLAEKLAAAERELINKAPIAAISRANARIKELNALKAKVLDPKDRENIDKQILEQQQNKGDALVATFSNVSARLSEAEGIAANFSEELAGAVSAAAGVANAFAQIASGNYIGGFIQLAKSVLDIQARIEQTKQAEKDADDMARRRDSNKLIEEANTLLEQQLALLDKIRGVDLYSGIINSKDALISALEEYNKAIEKLDLKDANTKYEEWGSSWFSNGRIFEYRKKNKFEQFDFSALQGLMSDAVENPDYSKIKAVYDEIERIRSLIADGTILGDTEDLEKQLKDYEDLLEKAEAFAAKQAELLTGSTYDSVVDGLAAAFDDGIYSAQEFADSFEKIMQKAIINSIKINALKGPLDDWYKQFTTLSEDGLSEEDINILKEGYMAIADGAALAFENMKEITGIDFGSSSFASLQGAIKGMSEETAGLLAGQFNALRINSAEHLNVAREALLYQAQTAANTAELSRQLNDIKGLIKPSSNDPLRGKGL